MKNNKNKEYYSFVDFLIFEKNYTGPVQFKEIKDKWNKYKNEYIRFCIRNNYLRDEY